MHSYIIDSTIDRVNIVGIITSVVNFISSIAIAMLLYLLAPYPATVVVSLLVFLASQYLIKPVIYIYDNYIWKMPLIVKITGVDDLSGEYQYYGTPFPNLANNASLVATKSSGEFIIKQTATKISIILNTQYIFSISTSARMNNSIQNNLTLSYDYDVTTTALGYCNSLSSLRIHPNYKGSGTVTFKRGNSNGTGTYSNSHQSGSSGSFAIIKI